MPSAGASFAAGPAGGPNVTVGITGDVTNTAQITDAIYDAFVRALKDVFTAPMWAKGARVMGAKMGKELEKSFTKVAPTISKSLNDAITKGLKSASASVSGVKSSLSNMVPHTLSAAIDRLIAQFDRLEKAAVLSPKPNVAMERILERLNRQATVATTEGARQQTAALNSALQNQAAATNAAAKKRVAIIQAMSQQIRALERGLAATIKFSLDLAGKAAVGLGRALRAIGSSAQAGARASAAAMRSLINAIQTVTRGVARLASGLATGFARGFAGVSRALASALRRDENALRSSLSRRERAVRSSASRQGAAMSGAFGRLGTLLPGLAGGAGIASILTSGFERFGQIETLQFRLERMLGSAEAAKAMIADVSDFARTTSFDLPGVANLATNFLTMGQSASESMVSIKRLADVTAFAGGNTESLERIQRALGQIISTGRLQGDELNQLAENLPGINIRQIIADQLGISTAELVKMQEAGELNADAFITAFLEGIDDPRFAGAATALGQTLTGRLANLKESFAIFGESLVGLVAGPLTDVFNKITDILTLAGGFVSGEMFKVTGPEDNPFQKFAGMAIEDVSTHIPFEELPQEIQDILQERNGWGPGEGYVLAGEHARQFWEELHPPEELSGSMQRLKEFRDIFGDFAKGAGGFLAFVGGLKLFGLALRFLTRPLTIVTGLFGALNAVWGKMMDASPDLRQAMRYLLYRVTPLAKAFGTLFNTVTSLVLNKIFGGEGSLFKRMGDNLAPLIRRMGTLMRLFQEWLTWADTMLKEGQFRKVIDSASKNIQGFLASILGLTDAQQEAAQALGGNDFGNIFTAFLDKLEDVPVLGPIVRFVRRIVDTISVAVRSVAGFVGDIWNDIFGGDDETTGDSQLGSIATSMFGTPAEQESIGTRILDRLESTFLGPVVRFFRGPFADKVEEFGGFIADIANAIFGEGEGGVGTRVLDRLEETFLGPVVRFFRGPFADGVEAAISGVIDFFQAAWDRLEPIVQPLIDAVTDIVDAFTNMDFSKIDIGTILQNASIGAAGGLLVGGPIGGIIGGVAGALFDPLVDSINNAWEDEIKPALEDVWDAIKGWFTTTFTVEKVQNAAKDVLEIANQIGFWIGKIATDPRVIAALVGLGVALLALLAATIVGVFQGVADNADEWGNILLGGLSTAFDYVKTEGPAALASAIGAIFTDPTVAASVLVGGLLVGTGIGRKVMGGIATFLKNRTETGKLRTALRGAITDSGLGATASNSVGSLTVPQTGLGRFVDKISTGLGTAIRTGATKLKNIGTAIGNSLLTGLIAFEAGNLAGRSGSTGGLLLALLTGAGVGFAAGGPWGAAFGVALAGVGAAIGAAGAAADKAAQETQEYVQSLEAVEDAAGRVASSTDTVLTNLKAEQLSTQQFLATAGFNARQFADDVIAGNFDINSSFLDLVDNAFFQMSGELPGGLGSDLQDLLIQIQDLGAEGKLTKDSLYDLMVAPQNAGALDALEALGLDANVLLEVYDLLGDESRELDDAIVETAVHAANADAAIDGMIEKDPAKLREMLSEVGGGFTDVIEAAEDAKEAVLGFFNTGNYRGSFEAFKDELALAIPDLGEGFTAAIEGFTPGTPAYDAAVNQFVGNFGDFLRDGAQRAVDSGEITSGLQLDAYREGVIAQIRASGLPPAIQELMIAEFEAGVAGLGPLLDSAAATAAAAIATAMEGAVDAKARLAASVGKGPAVTPPGVADGEQYQTDFAVGMANNSGVIDTAALDALSNVGPTLTPEATAVGTAVGTEMGTAIGAAVSTSMATGLANLGAGGGTGAVGITPAPAGISGIGTAMAEAIVNGFTTGLTPILNVVKLVVAGVGQQLSKMVAASGLYGTAAGRDMAKNFGSNGGGAVRAAQLIGAGVIGALRAVASGASSLGSAAGTGFAKGFGNSAGSAVRAAQLVAAGIRSALDDSMYSIGVNAGASFARGVESQVGRAVTAARRIAQATAQAARSTLGMASPSKVFIDIGHQIGEGFVQGIEESEGDMTAALETAITNAITTATDAAGDQVRRAKVGQAIFDALQTTMMPGGASVAADSLAMITRQQAGPTLARGVRGGASSRFLASGTAELHRAAIDINQVFLEFTEAFESLSKQNLDAWTAKGAGEVLTAQQRSLVSGTILTMSAGTFAGATNQRNILDALTTIKAFGAEMLETGHSAQHVASTMAQYRDLLRGQAVAVGLAGADFDKLATAMGLAGTQLNAMVVELTDLRWWTEAGGENARMILEEAQAIRDYASELLASGYSTDLVVARVNQFRDSLVQWAVALGFQKTQVDALIDQVGISATTVAEFTKQMKAFQDAAAGAAQPPAAGEDVAGPRVGELHIHIPSGDPEAVALVAANRLAYQNLTSW